MPHILMEEHKLSTQPFLTPSSTNSSNREEGLHMHTYLQNEQISSFTYFTPFSLFDHDLLSGPPSFLTKYVFLSCCILNLSNHSTQMDVISRS